MTTAYLLILSAGVLGLVVLLVVSSRTGPRFTLLPKLHDAVVRDLDLARGRCQVSAEAFVTAMPDYHRKQYPALNRFTRTGGGVLRLPAPLKAALLQEYIIGRPQGERETGPNFVQFGDETRRPTMVRIAPSAAYDDLHRYMEGVLRRWAACPPLEHTATYGVRVYHRGARLEQHVDRPHTHVISAIVHLAAAGLEREWPLHLLPHDAAEVCAVKFRDLDADVLCYESATVPHGRLDALAGDDYANIFLHYRPRGWHRHVEAVMGPPPEQ